MKPGPSVCPGDSGSGPGSRRYGAVDAAGDGPLVGWVRARSAEDEQPVERGSHMNQDGAEDGTRTRTPPKGTAVFKTAASAIPPLRLRMTRPL